MTYEKVPRYPLCVPHMKFTCTSGTLGNQLLAYLDEHNNLNLILKVNNQLKDMKGITPKQDHSSRRKAKLESCHADSTFISLLLYRYGISSSRPVHYFLQFVEQIYEIFDPQALQI